MKCKHKLEEGSCSLCLGWPRTPNLDIECQGPKWQWPSEQVIPGSMEDDPALDYFSVGEEGPEFWEEQS